MIRNGKFTSGEIMITNDDDDDDDDIDKKFYCCVCYQDGCKNK